MDAHFFFFSLSFILMCVTYFISRDKEETIHLEKSLFCFFSAFFRIVYWNLSKDGNNMNETNSATRVLQFLIFFSVQRKKQNNSYTLDITALIIYKRKKQ